MILDALELGLTPIIWLMQQVLDMFWTMTGSAGTAIILLSCLVALMSYPLRGWAGKIEKRVSEKKKAIDEVIATRAEGLKGEARFRIVETIYEENKYHPIHSIALGLSFLVMLPFLLSALFLLADDPDLVNVPYLFIPDLSKSDGVIGGLNLLPVIMAGVTIVDAKFRFSDDRALFLRFCVVACVLFALVYGLSSALVLYWTVSNIISMATYQFSQPKQI